MYTHTPAHTYTHAHTRDSNFPRLAQMLVDFENPVKKMVEEFIPLAKLILQAVMSLQNIYLKRNVSGDQLRSQGTLSISQNPGTMLNPSSSNELSCEFVSIETMHRWILSKSMSYFSLGVLYLE